MKEQKHDIRELAAKWMDGTITPEEKERFEKWYNGFDFSKLELLDTRRFGSGAVYLSYRLTSA